MNRSVVLFFGFTWIGIIADAATPFGAMEGIYNEHTKNYSCMIKHCYVIATSVTDFINDILILLAIMYKLGMANIRRSPTSPIGTWKPTGHSQRFTKVFLQDGQIYYT